MEEITQQQTAVALALQGKPITLFDESARRVGQNTLVQAVNLARQFGIVRITWESPLLNISDEITFRKFIFGIIERDITAHELEEKEFSIHCVERKRPEDDGVPWALIELVCRRHPLRLKRVANTEPPPGSIPT